MDYVAFYDFHFLWIDYISLFNQSMYFCSYFVHCCRIFVTLFLIQDNCECNQLRSLFATRAISIHIMYDRHVSRFNFSCVYFIWIHPYSSLLSSFYDLVLRNDMSLADVDLLFSSRWSSNLEWMKIWDS